jgi:hypothetical protein
LSKPNTDLKLIFAELNFLIKNGTKHFYTYQKSLQKVYIFIQCMMPEAVYRNGKAFKPAVMTIAYNAGDKARLSQFYDYFSQAFVGLGDDNINSDDITFISKVLNDFFNFHAKTKIYDISDYLRLIDGIVSEKTCHTRR